MLFLMEKLLFLYPDQFAFIYMVNLPFDLLETIFALSQAKD